VFTGATTGAMRLGPAAQLLRIIRRVPTRH
jgi:hypothetical protein